MDERAQGGRPGKASDLSPTAETYSNPPPRAVEDYSRLDRLLNIAAGVLVVLILGVLVLLIYNVFVAPEPAPRTAVERDLYVKRGQVQTKPWNAQARINLGMVYFRMGSYGEAHDEFQAALKLDPELTHAVYAQALTYKAEGNTKQAIRQLERLVKDSPTYDMAYYELGQFYLADNQHDKAIEAFKKGVEFAPYGADSHYYLGLAYERSGQKDLAINEYNEALKYVPDYPEATEGLKRLDATETE